MKDQIDSTDADFQFPSHAEHQKQVLLEQVKNTTPMQRLLWLEETIKLLAPYLTKSNKQL
ncbi:hypothetical protein OAO01_01465 [Oligoflexia bacterium]|nr:hypothetical protein [Oligoflexia bacterium]